MTKKWIALALAAMMALSVLTACGSSNSETKDPETEDVNDTVNDPAVGETDETPDAETPDTETPETPDAETPDAETPDAETPEAGGTGDADASLESVIDALYEAFDPGLGSLGTTVIDLTDADSLSYYTGLSDASLLAEAAVSEPMIGSQAYSLIVARVADAADAETVARDIMNNVDPRKWICVSADDQSAAVSGDLVLFVMIDEAFDNMNASDLTDAFISLYGGSVVTK